MIKRQFFKKPLSYNQEIKTNALINWLIVITIFHHIEIENVRLRRKIKTRNLDDKLSKYSFFTGFITKIKTIRICAFFY